MLSQSVVREQLNQIHFNTSSWGRSEVAELPDILLEGETISECVNGIYEGGFALLVATNLRVLLIDKKPLNYLTVEDLRFDMINEIDYSHRLLGAHITIATGSKTLRFRSYNQPRLRKLIGHVQHCMAEAKQRQSQHAEGQNEHLARINQQLQTYLLAQLQHQQELTMQLREAQRRGATVPANSSPQQMSSELKDYLLAQRLMSEQAPPAPEQAPPVEVAPFAAVDSSELYSEGAREVFGKSRAPSTVAQQAGLDINPMSIAYSKLPMLLRNRKFGRPVTRVYASSPAVSQT